MTANSIFFNDIHGICEVCKNSNAKYRCPNCGIIYCSTACYHNHNSQCVTKFSNTIIKEYAPKKVSTETKLRTRKLLDRYDSDKYATSLPLPGETETSIDPNNSYNDNALPPPDSLMPNATQPIEPWDAWWEKKIIVNFPKPLNPPPKQASKNLIFHLVDILYSYCYTMRLYNGDVTFDFEGACNVMITISSVLAVNTGNIPSVRSSLNQCVNNAKDPEIFVEFQWMIEVVHDVELCLQSISHVFRALSEAHAMAKEAKYKKVYKKLEFFFAWSQTLNKPILDRLSEEVHDYYTSLYALLFDIRE